MSAEGGTGGYYSYEAKKHNVLSDRVLDDVQKASLAALEEEAINVVTTTVAAMVATLHDFGDNLPDFREFEKVIEFDGGEYKPPSHCLSFNAVVPQGEEDELINTAVDKYGFYISDKNRPIALEEKGHGETESRREAKWREMLDNWDSPATKTKLKERVRKGIPNRMRPFAWPKLLDLKPYQTQYPVSLISREVVNLEVRLIDEIDRDVGRAFPMHSLFRQEGSEGQQNIRRVLLWYAAIDKEVGYCQGMSFVAATLLVYLPVDVAYHSFVSMMNRPICGEAKMRELFLPKMVRIQQMMDVFADLMLKHLPQISAHFTKHGVLSAMFVTPWFMTFYCRDFSFDLVSRVWDSFLNGDSKIIYRVGLALLRVNQAQIRQSNFEEIMALMNGLPRTVDAEKVWASVWTVKIRTEEIEDLERKHALDAAAR